MEEAELRSIKCEQDVWKFLNKTRKKREKTENKIQEDEWIKHFKTLLEGSDIKQLGEKREKEEGRNEENKITAGEIKNAWTSLK